MDNRISGGLGGIQGLHQLIVEHRTEVQYDLICSGLRLWQVGTRVFGWDDFAVWVRFAEPDSQLVKAVAGLQWSPELHRLTDIFEVLNAANWQRGGRGQKPKPIRRPGSSSGEHMGKAVTFERVEEFLMARNGRTPGG